MILVLFSLIEHFFAKSACSQIESQHALVFKFEPSEMKNTNIPNCNSQLSDNDTNQQIYSKLEETKDCHAQVIASNDTNIKDDITDDQFIKV